MIGLYAVKPWFVRRLKRIEDLLIAHRVSADSLTLAALFVSLCCGLLLALGGILEKPALWLLVPPLGLARLALNALDGSIARRTQSVRPFGEVLNEMSDRFSDTALIGSLAFAVPIPLALAGLAATLLSSFAGLLGRVVVGERLSSGPMGKADRVAAVAIGALVAGTFTFPTALVVAAWVVLIGSVLTLFGRLTTMYQSTKEPISVR